jgi:hypothetical protein
MHWMCPNCRRHWLRQARAAAAVERRIVVGIDLIGLRNIAPNNRSFAHTRRRFGVDVRQADDCMRVARRYGDRRAITANMTWPALVALSAPDMPDAMREHLELRVIMGERLSAAEIRKAGAHREIRAS